MYVGSPLWTGSLSHSAVSLSHTVVKAADTVAAAAERLLPAASPPASSGPPPPAAATAPLNSLPGEAQLSVVAPADGFGSLLLAPRQGAPTAGLSQRLDMLEARLHTASEQPDGGSVSCGLMESVSLNTSSHQPIGLMESGSAGDRAPAAVKASPVLSSSQQQLQPPLDEQPQPHPLQQQALSDTLPARSSLTQTQVPPPQQPRVAPTTQRPSTAYDAGMDAAASLFSGLGLGKLLAE